uniref:Uncharacterized protein n=1 Tax=Corvus moneduloides TaxID=1196302 RepID=A0A8U7N947_CORMO
VRLPAGLETAGGMFPGAPWVLLDPRQKALYRDVMHESYETLMSLGKDTPKISLSLLYIPLSFPCFKQSSLGRGAERCGQIPGGFPQTPALSLFFFLQEDVTDLS